MTKRGLGLISAVLAGLMCLCAVFSTAPIASAEGEIGKVTVRTVKNYDPYVLDSVLDHSATESSTGGAYTSQATWYDSSGNVADGLFDEGTYTVEITVYAMDGYSFAPDAAGYINNDPAELTYVDSGTVILRRQVSVYTWNYTQVWKNPGDEKLESGDTIASFVVSGVYFTDVSWTLVDTDGNNVSIARAGELFPDVSFQASRPDENTARMNIRNVPVEMNGWKIYATLSNPTSSANTGKAKITIADATPSPTPTATPTPEENNDDVTEQTGAEPSGGEAPDDAHEHSYSTVWRNSENGHWHECSCGEKSDLSAHSMSWTTVENATSKTPGREHGVCSVCGYTEDKEIPYEGGNDSLAKIFVALIALISVVILILIIEQARYRSRVRRRKAYKNKYR